VPLLGEDDVLHAEESELAVLQLVHEGLGLLRVQHVVVHVVAVDIVHAHRALLRAATHPRNAP